MSNEWKGRVIRGGIVVVGAMGLIGAMGGLTGIAVGYPGVVRAASSSSPWPPASVLHPSSPSTSPAGRGRADDPPGPAPGDAEGHAEWYVAEYREGANHQRPSRAHRIPLGPLGNGRGTMTSTDELRSDPNPVN